MKLKFLWHSLFVSVLVLSPKIALSELVITTKDGSRHTLPIDSSEVESIIFMSDRPGANWQGRWDTYEGTMNLSQVGTRVDGRYNQDNGQIEAQIDDNLLVGYWIEDSSARKCSTTKSNSYYWGKISWQLDSDGKHFGGKWSYCNDEPDSNWFGSR
ncbi:MAG: hypothetical protein AAFQ41_16515 [Cyanobacteria bacterium J06623_7]